MTEPIDLSEHRIQDVTPPPGEIVVANLRPFMILVDPLDDGEDRHVAGVGIHTDGTADILLIGTELVVKTHRDAVVQIREGLGG